MPSIEQILEVLSRVNDPELHRSLTDLKMVRDVKIHDHNVYVTLALTVPDCPLKSQIEQDVRSAILVLPEVKEVNVDITAMTKDERRSILGEPSEGSAVQYNHVQHIVAVMSGKGGVGKSLVTSLLAVALAQSGFQVGCWMPTLPDQVFQSYSACAVPWGSARLASARSPAKPV